MGTYLFVFLTSFFFLYTGQQSNKKTLTYVGLLIPIVMAGFRGLEVGTDTMSYYDDYLIFKHEDKYLPIAEPLFYVISRLAIAFNFYNIIFLIYEFICIIFLDLTINRLSVKVRISKAWVFLLYFLVAFNPSLNIMRQYAAMSYFMFASTYLFDNKYTKFILLSFVGISLHSTILICSCLLLIIYKISIVKKKRLRLLYTFEYIAGLVFMIVTINIIVVKFSSMGINMISDKANAYQSGSSHLNFSDFIISAFMLVVIYLLKHYSNLPRVYRHFMLMTIISDLAFTFIGSYNIVFTRFASYFSLYYVIFIPLTFYMLRIKENQKMLFKLSCLSVFFMYWVWTIVINNSGATIPYSFANNLQ